MLTTQHGCLPLAGLFSLAILADATALPAADLTAPWAESDLVHEEVDGVVAIEAEHFHQQSAHDIRAWHITTAKEAPQLDPDGDPSHVAGASGGAYLEILPDSRRNHNEKLIHGVNFSNEPGQLGILHYKVHFHHPGRYYVWVRAYSSGSEDNGIHVGLDGGWPESGRRLQWCAGKQSWWWESKQRTEKEHCGVPHAIYLDVPSAGVHEILFSMREDGFEFDKFILTKNRDFDRPSDVGPASLVKQGTLPRAFALVAGPATVLPSTAARPADQGNIRRQPHGDGSVSISGELRQWHKVTLTMNGFFAHERDTQPNPFTGFNFTVRFRHESGSPDYQVPGYFAADGHAANSSAESGTQWRAHLSPDKPGKWTYTTSFRRGAQSALGASGGLPITPFHNVTGSFTVKRSDKKAPDFRGPGRLQYVGERYLRHAGSGDYFLKAGPDAPETLLAYVDFDNTTRAPQKNAPLKTWQAHVQDWKEGDPTWQGGKGKGLIGALNYLSAKGLNSFSFLPYNAGGDGDNVWPFVERDDKLHYDVSKLDQWGVVFDHATAKGLHLHFKLQENEIDDNRRGHEAKDGLVPESLDGGKLGPERKLYCRELIARFGHNLALNWNIGEENTQSTEEIAAMVKYLHDVDPYHHPIVIHTFPDQQDKVYRPLLGDGSLLTGASLQNHWSAVHQRTLQWIRESAAAGRPWVVANDEQNPAGLGVPPDPGYQGFSGTAQEKSRGYDLHDIRRYTLWGNLMAGGAGVEYYFGYQLPQNDLIAEDWRSRDQSWDYCRLALDFFREEKIPFWAMDNADALIGNANHSNDKYNLAKPGEIYLVYLPKGGSTELDLSADSGRYSVAWFNPRAGGSLQKGSVKRVRGGGKVSLGEPPSEADQDWLIVVR